MDRPSPGYIFLGLWRRSWSPVLPQIIRGWASSQSMSALKKTGLLTATYFVNKTAISTANWDRKAYYSAPEGYKWRSSWERFRVARLRQYLLARDSTLLPWPCLQRLSEGLLPSNPLGALASGKWLQVVFIAVIIGICPCIPEQRTIYPNGKLSHLSSADAWQW
jgi:Na+/H+-dicarboxylate symporter